MKYYQRNKHKVMIFEQFTNNKAINLFIEELAINP